MTAPLGTNACTFLGCRRQRHVSPTCILYGACLRHTDRLVTGAFGTPHRHAPQPSAAYDSPLGGGARLSGLSLVAAGSRSGG